MGHLDSVVHTSGFELLFQICMLEEEVGNLRSEKVFDILLFLLFDVLEEFFTEELEDLQLVPGLHHDFLNTLRFYVDRLIHVS